MNVEPPPTVEEWNEYIKTKPEEWDAYESGCDCADCREFMRGFYDWRRSNHFGIRFWCAPPKGSPGK